MTISLHFSSPVASSGSAQLDHLFGQYTRVLRGLCHLQLYGLSPGGAVHGNGPARGYGREDPSQAFLSILLHARLGHGQ